MSEWVTPEVRAWIATEPKAGDVLRHGDFAYICTKVQTIPASMAGPRHKEWLVSPVNHDGRYTDHRGMLRFLDDGLGWE